MFKAEESNNYLLMTNNITSIIIILTFTPSKYKLKKKKFTICTLYRIVTSLSVFSVCFQHLYSVLCCEGQKSGTYIFQKPPSPCQLASYYVLVWKLVESYKVKRKKVFFFCSSLLGRTSHSGRNNSKSSGSSIGVRVQVFVVEVVEAVVLQCPLSAVIWGSRSSSYSYKDFAMLAVV